MKEICKVIAWEADDGTQFEFEEPCKIYDTILENPAAFFSQHFKWAEPRSFPQAKKFPWRYNSIAILIKPFTHDEMSAAQRYLDFSDPPHHLGLDRPYGLLNEADNKIGTVFKAVYTTDRENYDWEAIDSREKLEASNASFERMIKWNNEQIAILDKYSKGE